MISASKQKQISLQVDCEATKRKLARIDADGMYLWCKTCREEHLISWQMLPKFLLDAYKNTAQE